MDYWACIRPESQWHSPWTVLSFIHGFTFESVNKSLGWYLVITGRPFYLCRVDTASCLEAARWVIEPSLVTLARSITRQNDLPQVIFKAYVQLAWKHRTIIARTIQCMIVTGNGFCRANYMCFGMVCPYDLMNQESSSQFA